MGETVTLNTQEKTEVVESPEYIKEMVDKANGVVAVDTNTNPPLTTETKPQEKILGKFNSQDDLIKSYQELEKKLGQPKLGDSKPVNKLASPEKSNEVQAPLVDFQRASQEYNQTGQISEKTISEFEKIGINKTYIDMYMKGVEALSDKFVQTAYQETGGEENYSKMVNWVSDNLSSEEIKKFNDGVGQDDSTALYTIKGMYARFNQANREPNLKLGETSIQSSGDSYESIAQMKEDMKNPKYNNDPAYRKMVENKLSRSKIF